MLRTLRLAWVMLLTLALPLQGLAAATMVACGPAHHESVAAAAHDADAPHDDRQHGHAQHDHAHHAVTDHPAHAAHGHSAAVHDTVTHDVAATEPPPADVPAQTCSVCASCCTASAGLPTHATSPSHSPWRTPSSRSRRATLPRS
ncbi:MAG TPA: hypothetical protein VHM00_01045 [Caldimonas sp.]|jgi:hypothetical protein|nr:hypothetical protein [Caldimonas sp.]HEX2539648.1 hypothetical protein [Caldimonas sp.]